MSENLNYKLSRDIMDVMIVASRISDYLKQFEINTFDVFLAAVACKNNLFFEYLEEKGLTASKYCPEVILLEVAATPKFYEKYVPEKMHEDYKEDDNLNSNVKDILTLARNKEETRLEIDIDVQLSCDEVIDNALIEAEVIESNRGNDCIELDTLMYSILRNEEALACEFISDCYRTDVQELLSWYEEKEGYGSKLGTKKFFIPPDIRNFVTDLNSKMVKGKECEILGRDEEKAQVWTIISKKTKRNAVLVGEPGVGKSAIIEAITYDIVNKKCPKKFRDYTVLSLDLNSMVAGTEYRGEFEEKTQDFIKFIEKTDKIIVFLDEIHQLIGTGSAEGSGPDLSGSLKPLLARDNAVFIGATTVDEYERIFNMDGALSRRFEAVMVEEPKFDKVIPMIKSKVRSLSEYHEVFISDELLKYVLITASSFSNIANPDRTIDLVDKSMAVASISRAHTLTKKHVDDVYKKNFKNFRKIPPKARLSTAFHEAGHFAAWYLSKTKGNETNILVSIIPAQYWLGVNIFEDDEVPKHAGNMELLRDRVSISLGGRIAQKFVTKEIDSGASSDLQHATTTVENFIMKYGIDDEYINYSFDTVNQLTISDNTSDNIRKKTQKIISEVYEKTEKLLNKHKKSIENVANLLMEKGIITCEEATQVFQEGIPKRVVKKKSNSRTKEFCTTRKKK